MSTVYLKDVMGTRYLINALSGAQRTIMASLVGTGTVVDLAGCKLGPEGASILMEYYSTIDFCNSEDPYLDAVLKNNCARSRETVEPYESLDLYNVKTIDTYMQLVQEIPTGAKVTPNVSLSKLLDKVTLVMLIMSRPDVEFDIRSCASDIYDYVRDVWLSTAGHHEKYYELIPPDTVLRLPDKDGYFGCEGYGFQRESSFIRNRQVLPWEFGNTKIINMDGSGVDEEWRPVVEKCLDAFQSSYAERKPGKVLRNLLLFRNEEEK